MNLSESTEFFADLGIKAEVVDGLDNGMKGLSLLPRVRADIPRDYFASVVGSRESRAALAEVFDEASFLVLNQHAFDFWQRAMTQIGAPAKVAQWLNNRMYNRYDEFPRARFERHHISFHRDGGVFESEELVPRQIRILNHRGQGQVDSPTLLGRADEMTVDFIKEKVSRVMVDFRSEIDAASDYDSERRDFLSLLQRIVDAESPHDLCNKMSRVVGSLSIWVGSSGGDSEKLLRNIMGFDDPRFGSVFYSHHYSPTSSLVFPNWKLIHGKKGVEHGEGDNPRHDFFMPFFDLES